VTGKIAIAACMTATREGARHRRLSRKHGTAKAKVAVGSTQMCVLRIPIFNLACAVQISALVRMVATIYRFTAGSSTRSCVPFREQIGSGMTLSGAVRSGDRARPDASDVQERRRTAGLQSCALSSHRGA